MRKVLLLSLVAVLTPGWANATPILVSGGGTATVTYEGNVFYKPLVGAQFGPFSGTFVSKDQTSLNFGLSGTYTSADLDFANGFRWTETVTNNTGSAWSNYRIELGGGGVFFVDGSFPVPTFATVNPGPPLVSATTLPGSLTLSADKKRIDLVFAGPLAPGASFSLHIPFWGLATGGSFTLTEAATAIPEPAVLGLLGIGLVAVASRIRTRNARRQTRQH